MIHLYHGLFGSPQDWDLVLEPSPACLRHDLYQEPLEELLSLKPKTEDVLIGYSMGGRIALEIAFRNSFSLKKIILISTHPGLAPEELSERQNFESQALEKMRTLSPLKFADYWNQLPLFKSSRLGRDLDSDFLEKSANLFENFRLSKTSKPLDSVSAHHSKIIWITGTRDEKYGNLIEQRVLPLGIQTFETQTDHRALRDPSRIKTILRSEGIL